MVKKIILSVVIAVFGMVGIANATVFKEEYTGCQYVGEGRSYNFDFDMWVDNVKPFGTNSNLSLTTDAVGAGDAGVWESASIIVDLFSIDKAWEKAGFTLIAYNDEGNKKIFSKKKKFKDNNITTYEFMLKGKKLAAFEDEGWGSLEIMASFTNKKCHYNDFAITKVAMEVNAAPVPEPSTMLLFGAGALGLLGYSRKRSNKKG